MAIPSQARTENFGREGVETRRAAPVAKGRGEGIVQTTNLQERHPDASRQGGESRSWQENPLGRKACEGSSPSARTTFRPSASRESKCSAL